MRKILVVEDWGARTDALTRASKANGAPDGTIEVQSGIDWLHKDEHPLTYLTNFDAVLVDFNLSVFRPQGKSGGSASLRRPIAFSHRGRPIPVSTGMGVLLYARMASRTERFRDLRRKVVERTGGPLEPRLFSFVHLDETASKFFAVAAAEWLGTGHFFATTDQTALQGYLKDLRSLSQQTEAARIMAARPRLNQLMDWAGHKYLFRAGWEQMETYDFVSTYLESQRREDYIGLKAANAHMAALEERTGATFLATNAVSQWQEPLTEVQQLMSLFLAEMGDRRHSVDLLERYTDNPRPLGIVLDDSELFWTAPDVREALRYYRETHPLPTKQPKEGGRDK